MSHVMLEGHTRGNHGVVLAHMNSDARKLFRAGGPIACKGESSEEEISSVL
jgi:hypothetical protein